MPEKVKVGFFSLSCCEGCELAVLELGEKLFRAFSRIEIVESRLLMEKPRAEKIDVAFVEGSVISEHDAEKLRYIRGKSNVLVALGACAAIAGIPGIRNALPASLQGKIKRAELKPAQGKAMPVHAFVKTDFILPGCSISEQEFLAFLNNFLHLKKPKLEDVPVCFECKQKQNPCLLLQGIACLGPVTYAGCNALCPSVNAQCIGCRGFTADAGFSALDKILREKGFSKKERYDLFTYFNPLPKELEELKGES